MQRGTAAGVVVAVLVLAVGCASSGRGGEGELGTLLDGAVAAGAPGVAVVLRDGADVRREARGIAHGSVPMDADRRFRVGSVTKTFVATLVLMLAEDGTLSLDDTVERWLPGLLRDGRSITVRQLLSHTTGLFDYVDDPRVLRAPERRWTPPELIAFAAARERSARGTFAYSSTNYLVLGLIAERAGRATLVRQLQARLFEPLELRGTTFEPGVVAGPHVHGHRPPSHQGVVTGPPADIGEEPARWAWAAGAIVSTAGDLQRFFAALLRGQLLGPGLMRAMTTLGPAGSYRYGLGLATFPTRCGPAWGHTGNVQGTIAVVWNTRDASRQLVLVVNVYPLSGELEGIVRRLQDASFCDATASG